MSETVGVADGDVVPVRVPDRVGDPVCVRDGVTAAVTLGVSDSTGVSLTLAPIDFVAVGVCVLDGVQEALLVVDSVGVPVGVALGVGVDE